MASRISNVPKVFGIDCFRSFMVEECIFEGDSLADYIFGWLWDGHSHHGVAGCFGDFEIFLKTVALIVDEWHRDPTILDFSGDGERAAFERRPTSAFGDGGVPHAIFDRDNFTAATFHWLHLDPRR